MAYGHCCRRAGASGKERHSELHSRKLILRESLMAIKFFFFFCLLLVRATDLSEAEPTLTHMSIACLHKHHLVRYFFCTSLVVPCLSVVNKTQQGKKAFRDTA